MNAALPVLPQHLGGLHPFEQALVMGLAFGPFVILAIVVYVVRKRDLAEESAEGVQDPSVGPDRPNG